MKKSLDLLWIFLIVTSAWQVFGDTEKEFCESISLKLKCDKTQKYRPIDGRCNNLERPFLGAANTRLRRLLRSQYANKLSLPPKSVTGSELPSPRLVSINVFNDRDVKNQNFTQALAAFGQFIAHDVSKVPKDTSKPNCCQENGKIAVKAKKNRNCMHIPIPSSDSVNSGRECMNFVRSLTDFDIKCPLVKHRRNVPAQQINAATAALDLSQIYGTSLERLKLLRSTKNGELKVTRRFNTTWPLQSSTKNNFCYIQEANETCYFSGDYRINQDPQNSIINTIFIREHNRIAKELKKLNPHWSAKILFQEARRINIAMYQHIAYYGWFTTIFKERNLKKLGYFYRKTGGEYANIYNSSADPSIMNEFSSSIFRVLHTMIEGNISKISEPQQLEDTLRLSESYYRPKFIEGSDSFDSLLRGILTKPAQEHDEYYDKEVVSHLFKNGKKYGSDLKALDIQRGRDHGIATYNDVRQFCGFPRAQKWDDFEDIMDRGNIYKLKKLYPNVNDVDMNVGASLESPALPGVFLGYSSVCIIAVQLKAIQTGDRFWYETDDPVIRFTPEQLAEIRKASFAGLVCNNAGNIQRVPKNAFKSNDDGRNPLIHCSKIPKVNLKVFKED